MTGGSRRSGAGSGATDARRRDLLKGMLVGGGVLALGGEASAAAVEPAATSGGKGASITPSSSAAAHEVAPLPHEIGMTVDHPQSDVMVDVLKSLKIDYVAANPGSSFRGLHESLINYGGNSAPELITCMHEETAVAIATGYGRATGRPMAALLHSVVGLQHASMSIYHAFADRAPVLMLVGASLNADARRPFVEWMHSAQDNGAMVRDFTKWDDQPLSIQHFAESTVRAVNIATTVPMGPTLISIDMELQENPVDPQAQFTMPTVTPAKPAVADPDALGAIADALLKAEAPLILAQRYARTPAAMPHLVALAEQLQAPVVDSADRFNFPTDHPFNHSARRRAAVAQADVILALEPVDLWGALFKQRDQIGHATNRVARPDAKVFVIGAGGEPLRANNQDFQRYVGVTAAVDADAEATVPLLTAELKRRATPEWSASAANRGESLKQAFAATRERDRREARMGWDSTPITTGRLYSELWDLIKDQDWVLATQQTIFSSNWPFRIWDINRPDQVVCGIGAGAIGTNIGCSTGIALAHRGSGKLVINIQGDGDLLYAPGALWTAAHHGIPILHIIHNNRAYHQEMMHLQRMVLRRQRGADRAHIGTAIDRPGVNFAKLAQSLGVWAAGPIDQPGELKAALSKAIAVVKQGAPAVVDVVSQPR